MYDLKTNTAVRIPVGPLVDPTDGKTAETSLTVTDLTVDILQMDNDGTAVNRTSFSPTASGGSNDMIHISSDAVGMYDLELTAAQLNFLGNARIVFYDIDGFLVHWIDINVVSAAYFDWKYGTTIPNVNCTQISGDGTAADNLEAALDGTGSVTITAAITGNITGNLSGSVGSVASGVTLADDAITAAKFDESTAYPLKSADAGATAVARTGADSDTLKTLSDQIDLQATAAELAKVPKSDGTSTWNATALAAITTQAASALTTYDPPTKTEMNSAFSTTNGKIDAVGDYVDTEIAAIKAVTDKLDTAVELDGAVYRLTANALELAPVDGAAPTAAAIRAEIDANSTQLAAIKTKTDNLPASPAAIGSAMTLTAAYDAAKEAASQTSVNTISGYIDTEVAAILASVDTEVAAIKAKTDGLNFTGTDVKATLDGETVTVGTNNDKTGYALTVAYDAAKAAASQSSVNTIDGIVDAILEDTGTTIPGLLSAMDGKIDTVDTVADGIKAKTDSLTFTVAGDVDVNVQSWKGAAAPEMTGDAYARLGAPAGLSVSADIAAVKSDTAAVLVDTNELQVDLTNGGRLDLILDGILEDTGTTLPGTLSTIEGEVQVIDGIADAILVDTGTTLPATLSTISGYIDTEVAATLAAVDTEVAAIKAKTDNLPLDPADQSAVEAAITAAHATTNGKIDTVDGIVDGILVDTGTTLPATLTAIEGKIDTIDTVSDSLTSELAKVPKSDGVVTWNLTALASIQQEATDALNAYDPPTKTEMDAGLDVIPTVAEIRTEMEKAGTHLTLILEDTGTTLPGTLSTISGYVDTEVAAIKAKTDQLNFVGTDVKATLDSEKVVVVSNEDKTGYALTAAYDEAKTAAQAGDKMDLVDVPSSGAVGVIQNGLATQASVDVVDGLVDEIKTSTDKFATMIVLDGSVYQFTENSLSLVPVAEGSLTAGQVADAVCEELLADHDDVAGSLAEAIANYTGVGPGTGTLAYTLTYVSGETNVPIPNAIVWLTTDLAGLNKVRSGVTNEFGVVTFDFLAGGTYYVWRSCAGFYFDNPDVEEVVE